jgi:peptide/nickel transport system permease protein
VIRRLAQRLAWAVFVVWATATIAFVTSSVLPSDPARMVAGPQARPQDVERIRGQLGLDKPVWVRYRLFVKRLVHVGPNADKAKDHETCGHVLWLHADLGRSFQQRRGVIAIIGDRLPRTALLAVAAVLVQVMLGVITGTFSATRKGRPQDHAAVALSLVGVSAPTYLIGLLLQFVFSHKLRILPLDGYGQTVPEHLACLVLPALTLGIFGASYYTRLVRDEMITELRKDYVRTARAKGVSRAGVVVRHALRNALVPIVTVVGLDLGALLGGAIVTEQVFRWPGLGSLSVTAVLDRDGPVIMGCVLVTAVAVVTLNLVVDTAYAVLDPRVRKK